MGIAELNHRPTPNCRRLHLAFPGTDLAEARRSYGGAEGRSSDDWAQFGFFGHQSVVHKVDRPCGGAPKFKAFVDMNRLFATG